MIGDLIQTVGTPWVDYFQVLGNDGVTPVTDLVDGDFTKTLIEDGILITDTLVQVSHLSTGIFEVSFTPIRIGDFALSLNFDIGTSPAIPRTLFWGALRVRQFGTEDLLAFAFGDQTRVPGNPTLHTIKSLNGQSLVTYNVTDTARTKKIGTQ